MAILRSHCLVTDVTRLPPGHIRAGTHLKYFDDSGIDLFIDFDSIAEEVGVLTDFGQTLANLADHQIKWNTREEVIRGAIKPFRVRLADDWLFCRFKSADELAKGLIELPQACARVSCMAFARRERKPVTLVTRVGEVLDTSGLRIKKNHRYQGPYDKKIKVDFRVMGNRPSAVIALGRSHSQANEVLRKWVDLKKVANNDRFLTVYDNEIETDYPEDLKRIHDISEVFGITETRSIAHFIKGTAA